MINSRTAEVAEVKNGRRTFRREDGRNLERGRADPQLRHFDRAELVTDDAKDLRAQLQAVTDERIAAPEGIGETARATLEKAAEAARPG